MSDPYAQVSKGKLPFKSDKLKTKKKKKSKDNELDEKKLGVINDPKLSEELIKLTKEEKINKELIEKLAKKEVVGHNLTPAEKAFKDRQEKMQAERILKKASKTHKQRVEEFNSHLSSLSEHYEMQKVSWTK